MKPTILKFTLFLFLLCSVSAYANGFFDNPSPDALTSTVLTATAVGGLASLAREKCTITPDEIKALEAKYGKIKILSIVIDEPIRDDQGNTLDPGEVYHFALRRPDAGHAKMLMKYAGDGEIEKFITLAIKNLVVAGDLEKIESDGLVYMALSDQLQKILKPYQSFLTNA